MIDELEAIERGDQDRLMVHLPPRHGKSLLCSVLFPAWYLGRHPDRKVILASYGAELSHDNGRACRNLVLSDAYHDCYSMRVTEDSAAAHRWHTDKGGGLIATGIPGPITGRGANLLIPDDPLRGYADAQSETVRESVYNWWRADARSRLEPPAAIVMPCTRWHEDDLPGRLLAEDEAAWRVISMPAIGSDGVALWADRFSLPWLERTRQEIGEAQWAALYQQEPMPPEGHIFHWLPEYEVLPEKLAAIYIPLDTAYTASQSSDYTACAAWGSDGAKLYLLEAMRCREEIPTAERMVRMFYEAVQSRHPGVPVSMLVRKSVAIDRIAAQHLRLVGIPVVDVELPGGNTKEGLANLVVHRFEGQTALIPQRVAGNGWLDAWQYEHKAFPAAKHDDWVETTIIVLHHLTQGWHGPLPKLNLRVAGWVAGKR